ncbi:GGDEF domain-containing protein [Methylogaea oryzae]|uniref:GGDEF domain-containing protein n=1 Tax=Methylogaea oryzae TaxID=1295382 RepID=UPI001C3F40DA|nr:GGDEF domain-containing protein [Methylogaea oryzae]
MDDLPLEMVALFEGVDAASVEDSLGECDVVSLAAGELLLAPGQENAHLYVVVKGGLRVHLKLSRNKVLAILGPGECVGEMSVLENLEPSALVRAEQDSELLVIPRDILWSLIGKSHDVAINLLTVMCSRLRRTNHTVSREIENCRQFKQASRIDALTGLYNRRWLRESFERLLERQNRAGGKLAVLMTDVDHFKQVNDVHGHLSGDRVLNEIGTALLARLRPSDLAVRYGGEEILVILPDMGKTEALEVAERLRLGIKDMRFTALSGEVFSLTASFGVAESAGGETCDQLLHRADAALYRAKRRRDCVCD